MLNALSGETCTASPDAYVQEVFDSYSVRFEKRLIEELEYCVPEKILGVLAEIKMVKESFEHGLDLGCGTGLSGEPFAAKVKVMDGVDLSPKMIEIAKTKNIYHRLQAANIVDYLKECRVSHDFFLAADVFGYVGDLAEVFSLIRECSSPDVLFCFSTETLSGEGFLLKPTGRFAHSLNYILQLVRDTGWQVIESQSSTLRKERGSWVEGELWFLKLHEA